MADVKGLLSDPDFQKLDPTTQKSTLGKLDPEFSSLTDDQFNQFKSKLVTPKFSGFGGGTTDKGNSRGATGSFGNPMDMSRTVEKGEAGRNLGKQWDQDIKPALDMWLAGETGKGAASLVQSGVKAVASGAAGKFLSQVAGKAVASIGGAVAAREGAKKLGAPEWAADLAGLAGGAAGAKAEGWIESLLGKDNFEKLAYGAYKEKYGRQPETNTEKLQARGEARKIANDSARVAKPPKAEKPAPLPEPYKSKPVRMSSAPTSLAPSGGDNSTTRLIGMKGPDPAKGLPVPVKEAPADTTVEPYKSKPLQLRRSPGAHNPLSDSGGSSSGSIWKSRPSPAGELSEPKTPKPGVLASPSATAGMDASKVKEAADLVRSMNATPESLKSAPQAHWDAVAKQVGATADDGFKKAVMDELGAKVPKPSPKAAADIGSGPKTPKPSPGGAKVESTMTPEARAARADEHAAKLAATIRKTLPADKIPEVSNDAAWKVLEAQTGTEATPAVRKAAIDKARKLWSEGPRSAGDLQKRRSEYFAKAKAPASSSE